MVSLPFSKVPANAGIVALTAALLGILAWFGSSAPLGSYFDLGKADAAAFSVSCLQLEYLGYPTYDKYVPCRVTMNPGARIQVGFPNKYNGKLGLTPGPSQDVRPFNWGIISTEPGWSCSQPHSMGLVCDPNGDASGTLDIGFEAVGDCGTSVNIWATQMPVGQGPKSFADDGTWVKTVFTFPRCPAVQASSSSVAVSSNSSSSSSMNNAPACSNGRDDDHDGKVDYQDPGCYQNGFYNPNDTDESDSALSSSSASSVASSAPACSDGRDNDGDGVIDAQDIGCYQNGFYNPNDNDEYNASSSSSSSYTSSSSSAYPCSWLGNCPQSSVSSSQSSVSPCGWHGCQPSSASLSSRCSTWCGWGLGNWFNSNANANTVVNNQVNAGAQNNTAVNQQGGFWQNAIVTPTATTNVNNQINAGSHNNLNGWVW